MSSPESSVRTLARWSSLGVLAICATTFAFGAVGTLATTITQGKPEQCGASRAASNCPPDYARAGKSEGNGTSNDYDIALRIGIPMLAIGSMATALAWSGHNTNSDHDRDPDPGKRPVPEEAPARVIPIRPQQSLGFMPEHPNEDDRVA